MMGIIIDLMQWAMIIYLMVMTLATNRRLSRPTTVYQMLPSSQPEEPKAICGCNHHKCFHDENGCGHNSNTYEINSVRPNHCGCKGYMGPEHLPQVIP